MITRDKLTEYIEQVIGTDLLIKARQIDPLMANGVQFHGSEKVHKVALGVSLNSEFLRAAVEAEAQYCIFHHGFDSRTVGASYSQGAQARLRLIVQNNLTIAGYHYALDAQADFGNNATIANLLGAKITGTLDEWGFVAQLSEPMTLDALTAQCSKIFAHDILMTKGATKQVQTLGIVSGAGKPYHANIEEMHHKGVELYISGESSESRLHAMQEEGISYLLAGHYATEVFGVQELGKKLKAHYKDKLDVEFIDIPNPL